MARLPIASADMLRDLMGYDGDLRMSGWEIEFIEDLSGRKIFPLSDKQSDKLDQIWDKIFGN